jgi:hypothetical protein
MKSKSKYTGLGIALGAGLGAALGAMAGNMGVWLAVGVGVGVAIGASIKRKGTDCPLCADVHREHSDGERS